MTDDGMEGGEKGSTGAKSVRLSLSFTLIMHPTYQPYFLHAKFASVYDREP